MARSREELEALVAERTREREVALAQLHEAQKMETIGQLTGGIAHDFNNLLTPVMGNLDLLYRRLPEDAAKSRRLVENALQATGRAATLVQRLLAFARRQDLQPRAIDVSTLIAGMEDLISRSLGPNITVLVEAPANLPAACADPGQLELAVLNLAINARDAMSSGGTLRIAVAVEDLKDVAGSLAAGRYLRIRVSDTGVGMDAATLRRAIEPFFSTKGVGRGTGLGLSMVHGLAAQSGGELRLMSKPGSGTTADLLLPSAQAEATAAKAMSAEVTKAPWPATILLVDDEPLVRSGTAELLADLGYSVLQASSAAEALGLLRTGEAPIDLLVTDYLMPGMNGDEMVRTARKLVPELPALLITGYTNLASGASPDLVQLRKPFRQSEIAAVLHEMLCPSGRTNVLSFADLKRPDHAV